MLRRLLSLLTIVLCALPFSAQSKPRASSFSTREARAARAFDKARQSPLELRAFLVRMPKGADLHLHLGGAVYAETFLEDARVDLLCVDPRTLSLVKNVGTSRSLPPQPVCAEGNIRADSAFRDQQLYNSLVDSFSMRAFVPTPGVSAHDHFFSAFGRFGAVAKSHTGEWLDEVATRAAAQNEQYLEIMETPPSPNLSRLAAEIDWPHPASSALATLTTQETTGTAPQELAQFRDKLLAAGLREDVATDRREFAEALASRNAIEHCGQPNAAPACSVEIRFLFQVLRSNRPEVVFTQTLLAFEVAAAEAATPHPIVVGLNLVQPEDDYLAMSEYTRQMRMLDYLHTIYPQVHISLHAGEIAPGLVPPEGLRFHIRQAVDLGHAERIGHGVDVMYETDPQLLLKEMAERHIMVEINLTSNDVILGVSLNRHSLPAYRAATDFNLGYLDLKSMARTSLEHSFLPGASLWASPDLFTRVNPACAAQPLGSENVSTRCTEFLKSNVRAAEQWQLEHRYEVFESTLP